MVCACGIARNLAYADAQSTSLSGGRTPETGFHSVMERPLSVRRVIPPITTAIATETTVASSQRISDLKFGSSHASSYRVPESSGEGARVNLARLVRADALAQFSGLTGALRAPLFGQLRQYARRE